MTNASKNATPEVPELARPARALPIHNRSVSLKAHALAKAGHMGALAGRALGITTRDANDKAAVGHGIAEAEDAALSASEMLLVRALAMETLYLRGRGECRSAECSRLGRWVGKSKTWAATTCRKRLGGQNLPDNLRVIERAGGCNGHIWFTPMGWTVALAMMTDDDIARTQPRDASQ